ncbi:MAG: hypothetical protein CVU89_04040 [Firmicutes bacterium HGW-Firmicutes-14]|jgi:hypothetical protein|nr:MAG: hypothetical protein CVU89_04040 [Firmicutes bacterium HGW-Firmicutes-14]
MEPRVNSLYISTLINTKFYTKISYDDFKRLHKRNRSILPEGAPEKQQYQGYKQKAPSNYFPLKVLDSHNILFV